MAKLTRRDVIKKTSAGAAALGALAVVPGLTTAQAATPEHATTAGHEPLIAYVRDRARGEVALLVGTREIITHDPELVRRLLKAAR